jgi:hypothetical protein
MNLDEAKLVIRSTNAEWVRLVEAAGIITDSRKSSFEDLLECVKRKGLCAELAVCALYVRTARPRRDDSVQSVVLDANDWEHYLKQAGHI